MVNSTDESFHKDLKYNFTKVTPLSKTLALIIFILMPFIGFYFGMKYQSLITIPKLVELSCSNSLIVPNKAETNTIDENVVTISTNEVVNDAIDKSGMLNCQQPEMYCYEKADEFKNKVTVPLDGYKVSGYSLIYPSDWTARIAGAEGMNFLFNESKQNEIFLQLTTTEYSLLDSYKADYGFEFSTPEPLVDMENGEVTQKRVFKIQGKDVMVMDIKYADNIKRYYLLIHEEKLFNTLYVFSIENNTENKNSIDELEKIIGTMNFTQDK